MTELPSSRQHMPTLFLRLALLVLVAALAVAPMWAGRADREQARDADRQAVRGLDGARRPRGVALGGTSAVEQEELLAHLALRCDLEPEHDALVPGRGRGRGSEGDAHREELGPCGGRQAVVPRRGGEK